MASSHKQQNITSQSNKDDPASQLIKYVFSKLIDQVDQINEKMNQKYNDRIDRYEQKRFNNLQQCIQKGLDIVVKQDSIQIGTQKSQAEQQKILIECIGKFEQKKINVDFINMNSVLTKCINKIVEPISSKQPYPVFKTLDPQIYECVGQFQKQIQRQLEIGLGQFENPSK